MSEQAESLAMYDVEVPIKATLFTASFNIFEAHQLTNLLLMEEILHHWDG